MRLILCDIDRGMIDAWQDAFKDLAVEHSIETFHGDFRDLGKRYTENIVLSTAGNSFGVMGGGLDLAVANHFRGIEEFVQSTIRRDFCGEIPVGGSAIIPLTLDEYKPFVGLLYTPTMYTPTRLQDARNIYLATRSALRTFSGVALAPKLFMQQLYVEWLVLPGYGRMCGGVPAKVVARTMAYAYKQHVEKPDIHTHAAMRQAESALWKICTF